MQKLLCLLHNKSTQNIQIKEEKPKKNKIILRNAVMPCLKKKEKPIEIKQEKPIEIKQEKKPIEKKINKSVKKTKKNDVTTSQNINKNNIKSNPIKEKQNKSLTKEDVY